MSFHSELYSHILLIPVISGYFFYLRRREVVSGAKYSYVAGIILLSIGSMLYLIGKNQGMRLDNNDYLSLAIFSALVFWTGGLVFSYGARVFRVAAFPILFLLLMIPVPNVVIEPIILFLQTGSADVSYGLFKLLGIPVVREGFVFHLPGVSVEVAKQCSGIRSSIALFIVGLLSGALFLETSWRKVILLLFIVPVAVIKNGVRIVTLSVLGLYVNRSILEGGALHKKGGVVFFLLALLIMYPILGLLRKSEKEKTQKKINHHKIGSHV